MNTIPICLSGKVLYEDEETDKGSEEAKVGTDEVVGEFNAFKRIFFPDALSLYA